MRIKHVVRPEGVYVINLAARPVPRLARTLTFQADGHGARLFGARLERNPSLNYRPLFLYEVEAATVLRKSTSGTRL